ncbi:MAG: TIGR00282 family metallophosphoesterase [Eubacteriales bacterium]|nr:YmdB family metallophosphoesterase [Clostridiales bacterium]MDY3070878.1 TIGR00282 family metallophosphoesterase [Eubacteriales bacterium]MDY5015244.1 TIGR00282 family metallophosphoesterase [Eubacteriales bacterium]
MRILAVGDVCGPCGVSCIERHLPAVREELAADAVIVNAENAAVYGIRPDEARRILNAGADMITLGNHTFKQKAIASFLDESEAILRPANLAPSLPGQGMAFLQTPVGELAVLNLIGRCDLPFGPESPFTAADRLLARARERTAFVAVDFHAEATSEKYAMAYYLDGRAGALWGTHTHVQTADERVFPGGTGFLCDLGMTGARDSIIGVRPDTSVAYFLGDMLSRFVTAEGPAMLCGALFTLDDATGRCVSVERVRYDED